MTQLAFNNEPARARVTDPDTSWCAATSVSGLTEKRAAIVRALGDMAGDGTDEEIEHFYDTQLTRDEPGYVAQTASGLRTRRSECVRAGWVHDSGRWAPTKSGRKSTIWELTDTGWSVYEQMDHTYWLPPRGVATVDTGGYL